jgi:hypothetical protein
MLAIMEQLTLNFGNGLFHLSDILQQTEFRVHSHLGKFGEAFCRQLTNELSMFTWLLARSAGCWIYLLIDETIMA